MRHNAFLDTEEGAYLGRCHGCDWAGPLRFIAQAETPEQEDACDAEAHDEAQDDCTWHETQMRIEQDGIDGEAMYG